MGNYGRTEEAALPAAALLLLLLLTGLTEADGSTEEGRVLPVIAGLTPQSPFPWHCGAGC